MRCAFEIPSKEWHLIFWKRRNGKWKGSDYWLRRESVETWGKNRNLYVFLKDAWYFEKEGMEMKRIIDRGENLLKNKRPWLLTKERMCWKKWDLWCIFLKKWYLIFLKRRNGVKKEVIMKRITELLNYYWLRRESVETWKKKEICDVYFIEKMILDILEKKKWKWKRSNYELLTKARICLKIKKKWSWLLTKDRICWNVRKNRNLYVFFEVTMIID